MALDHLLHHALVLHEVGRPKDGRRNVEALDHSLDRVLAGEVRHIGELVRVDDRQVDDALDARLARQVQRDEGLRHFVGRDGVQQEQRTHR
ncbi:hypothetical protein FQZ97_966170 [compost metagenome]